MIAERAEDLLVAVAPGVRVGVDVVDMEVLGRQLRLAGDRLAARLFTASERDFCAGDADRLASTLAGKEAVAKVLGTGLRAGVEWTDIEVLREPAGRPYVCLTGRARARAVQLGLRDVSVTLCHEGTIAVALACGVPCEAGR